MLAPLRHPFVLATLLVLVPPARTADEPLSKAEINKLGKAATAFLESPDRKSSASAFCIHASGLFLTNEHALPAAGGAETVTLVLSPGEKAQKVLKARVVRKDKELDLALLRVEGEKDLPALALGSDKDLAELTELIAFGFPFGAALRVEKNEYPAISVNVGSVTSLRRKGGELCLIQLDAALNPGNSGGPVLDRNGKVVGVAVAGIKGAGVNFAIPASVAARFLARPEVQFEPPQLLPGNVHKPVPFEARVASFLPSATPLAVDLILKPAKGPERTHHMQADGDSYRVTAAPVPPPPDPLTLRLQARFDNGTLSATATDRAFKVGDREVKLSDVLGVRFGAAPRVVFHDSKRLEGAISGLDAVPVRLGDQTLSVNLAKAEEVKFTPAVEAEQVEYTLLVRQGDKEIFRQSGSLMADALLKNPGFEGELEGWSTDVYGARPRIEFDTDVVREGWQALRVSATEPSDTAFGQEVKLKPGQSYRLSGWVRTRGLDPHGSRVYGTFQVQQRGGGIIANGTNHGGDTEWTEVSIPFQAPADGLARICVFFVGYGKGTGTAWFDDLKLVEVTKAP
jgi:hypothetical protein